MELSNHGKHNDGITNFKGITNFCSVCFCSWFLPTTGKISFIDCNYKVIFQLPDQFCTILPTDSSYSFIKSQKSSKTTWIWNAIMRQMYPFNYT